jgi:hypothetical protein
MVCYEAALLTEIERCLRAIQNKTEDPDGCIEMPAKAFS